ncbi:hypothetical protein [Streptomyces griseoluteus]|uniref:hypothetical protein n=1 Tax=Streptomyces griseoluteus TaxID=29306 RepID=UPI0036FD617A
MSVVNGRPAREGSCRAQAPRSSHPQDRGDRVIESHPDLVDRETLKSASLTAALFGDTAGRILDQVRAAASAG